MQYLLCTALLNWVWRGSMVSALALLYEGPVSNPAVQSTLFYYPVLKFLNNKGFEPSKFMVVVPARQSTKADGIDVLE